MSSTTQKAAANGKTRQQNAQKYYSKKEYKIKREKKKNKKF